MSDVDFSTTLTSAALLALGFRYGCSAMMRILSSAQQTAFRPPNQRLEYNAGVAFGCIEKHLTAQI